MEMVDLTNFDSQMKKRVTEIKSIIQSYLPEEEGFQRTLLEAINYSMLVGGKKLRGTGREELAGFHRFAVADIYPLFKKSGQKPCSVVITFAKQVYLFGTHFND